jgi:superfamily II DNA or RNA helicase
MANFSTFVSSFNQATKGKQFEVFVKWFLENDPVWKSEVDKVWMWDDYPDRWGKDCGIDLVFRDKNNETWAVQAKCYDREYPVTKTDVDSFLSESNRPLIQRRLLIATTDNLGPNARKVCAEQEKPVTLFLFSDFEDSAIDYPESISDLSRAKLKPKPQPTGKYAYQLEPINAVVDKFKTHDKGQLIMACGTGKTFTTLWIKEKLNAETTLILLPSLSLLSQTLKEWTFAMNQPFKSLCVCSDETVSKGASEDQLLETVKDLSFPVTADPNLIRKFLNSPGTKVLFSTYQSSPMIAEAQKLKDVPAFDLVIADEAHRCAGKVSSSFTTVLNDDLIRSKKKLFTTATPRTYSSSLKKQAEELDFEISGMDDEKVFGTEFYRLSFGNAIERGLLTDYQLVIIGVDEPMIADWIKRRELLQTNDEVVDAKSLAAEIGLIKAIKDYNLKRVLSFHSRVKSAEDFSKELPKVLDLIDGSHKPKGKLATGFVSGKMPTNQRRLRLDQLKELTQGDYAVLSNARCLSEGVDVPALDGIVIIDPKASQIDIVQTVGRAIRLSENKSVGTIVLPVFIENGDDPVASIESTNFKPLWDVVKALRSHDEMLAYELDSLRTEMGIQRMRSVQVGGLKKIVIDVPQNIDSNFSKSLRTFLVEKTTASWQFFYGLLKEYKDEFGDCNVPIRYKVLDNWLLGRWVSSQRYQQDTLSPEGKKQLNDLGFLWDVLEASWNENFEALKVYKVEHGDCKVPATYKTSDGIALGAWVSFQRLKIESLSDEKKKRLEDLGFVWSLFDELWNSAFAALKVYKDQFGDCNVPNIYKTADGLGLGKWVGSQRNKKNTLSPERIKQLDDLGFIWNPQKDRWDETIEALKAYKDEKGNCDVPKLYKTSKGLALGEWAATQRNNKNKISSEKLKQLDDLGFVWNSRDDLWNDYINALRIYKNQFGDCNVPAKYKTSNGLALGSWLGHQRIKVDISPARKKQLDDMGVVWNFNDELWNINFEALKSYKNVHGDCNVIRTYKTEEGLALGRWIGTQRLRQNILSDEKKKRLEDLGFVWSLYDDQWNESFKNLKIYKKEFGDCNVPSKYKTSDGLALGLWVSNQRRSKEKLSSEKIAQLDDLGFIWKAAKGPRI